MFKKFIIMSTFQKKTKRKNNSNFRISKKLATTLLVLFYISYMYFNLTFFPKLNILIIEAFYENIRY